MHRFVPPTQCTHIKSNGLQCGSSALSRGRYCYFHHAMHDLRRRQASAQRRSTHQIVLPILEDANSVQIAIMQVVSAILDERLDNRRAGLLLFALQTASANLKRVHFEPYQLNQRNAAQPEAGHVAGVRKDRRVPRRRPHSAQPPDSHALARIDVKIDRAREGNLVAARELIAQIADQAKSESPASGFVPKPGKPEESSAGSGETEKSA